MKWYNSLKVQMSVLIVLLNTVILGGFGFYNFMQNKARMTNELVRLSEVTANRLSKHLVWPVWSLDKKQTEDALVSEMLEKKIYAIIVRDNDGKSVIIGKKRDSRWRLADSPAYIRGDFIQKKVKLVRENDLIGYAEVYITKKYLKSEIWRTTMGIIFQVVVLDIAIFITIFLLIRNKIIMPLENITVATGRMSLGKLNIKFDVKPDNEIGLLVDSIERMKASLGIAIKRILVKKTGQKAKPEMGGKNERKIRK